MIRVLLVDDDANLLRGLLRQLRRYRDEWDVQPAPGGREAMRMMREEPFDIVVTDILMPDQDGIETIVALRREFPEVGILAMSGGGRNVGREFLGYARRLGADDAIEKPFDTLDLATKIRSLTRTTPDDRPVTR